MSKKEYKGDIFAVTFKLNPDPHQKKVLDKKINAYVYIYNKIQTSLRRKYQYCVHLKDWPRKGTKLPDGVKMYDAKYDILSKNCIFEFHNSRTKEVEIRPIFDRKGLEYSFINYIKEYLKKHNEKNALKILNKVDIGSIASNICKAWEKTIIKGTKYPKNLNKDEDPSFKIKRSKDNFIGADVSRLQYSEIGIKEEARRSGKITYIPFEIKENGYEDYAFASKITALSFKRVKVRNKYDYFVIFTFEGEKPKKDTYPGKGIVGIDLGTSDISIASDTYVGKIVLGQGVETIEKKDCRN